MRAARVATAMAVLATVALIPSGAASAGADEFPNLVPLPAFDIAIQRQGADGPALRFAAATANKGDFALELFGQPEGANVDGAAASQCVEWTSDRVCASRRSVGRFLWHPQHGHYHFEDFALYELRRFRTNGAVDFRPKGLIATSGKVSFCVIDVEQDRPADSPLYAFPYPLYYSCFTGTGFQGISPGWRDVYSAGTQGQEFPLDSLLPGRAALVIHSDPEDRLFETSNGDNISVAGIEISSDLTKVEVVCVSEPGSRSCDLPPPKDRN